jgi:hypothetical protein
MFVEDVCWEGINIPLLTLSNMWQEHNPLERIHNDLYCINHLSLACEKYILTFIDDPSRFS